MRQKSITEVQRVLRGAASWGQSQSWKRFAARNVMCPEVSEVAGGKRLEGCQNPSAGRAEGTRRDWFANANSQAAKRALLIEQEKESRQGVERLYTLSGELRDEVQRMTTTEVLLVHMYKKTEEIEKLAK